MAPGRGKGKARDAPAPRRSARSRTNGAAKAEPDVYGDMVAEAVATEPLDVGNRPLKRRKMSRGPGTPEKPAQHQQAPVSSKSDSAQSKPPQPIETPSEDPVSAAKPQQTAEYSSESEESDFAFEDVDLGQTAASNPASAHETDDEDIKDVTVSVAPPSASKKTTTNRRKPATAVEKAFRLRFHKIHFLTLLGHCMYANSRCNNTTVQKIIRRLVDKRMKSYLNPKTNDSQFQRNRSFMDGLEQAKNAFKAEYRITASGMARPRWAVDEDGDDESTFTSGEPMDLADFATAAKDLEGSQDTGNQLFCAMLRAAGVEARLVCSLQTLPYASPPPKSSTPKKTKKPAVFAIASDTDPNLSDASASDASIESPAGGSKIPSVRRRLGQPGFSAAPKVAARPKEKKKPIRTLSYPVYWVEAFNTAHQKWVPVDPMATNTVGKAGKIEPPASYDLNQMMYVVAFEEDGVARDVTRRYAKAFNAKTRRQRVEGSGEDGAKWLKAALRPFRRRKRLDRDQVEDAELAQKEAREGLPSNVLDFKGHPYYALERHLRRHEVLHPRREAGKVNAGTAAKPKMEPVFRRQDVLACKSADKWYRLGREVKQGEQPLKHVPARASRRKDLGDEGDDMEPTTTGLYSIHQTHVYVPPPVKRGRIMKNAFGNLDVYVPSMVPPGGVHIRHPLTQQAARTLNIDFADAVTGFKFQGRQGTAIIEGAVVPQEYGEAVHTIIEGLEYEALEEESRSRSLTALRLWARFMKGLRIAERVAAYGEKSIAEEATGGDIEEADFANEPAPDSADAQDATMLTAGQYSIVELTMPSKATRKKKAKAYESDAEDNNDFVPSTRRSGRKRGIAVLEDDEEHEYTPDNDNDASGGGFLPEDAHDTAESGGGFVPEPHDAGLGGGFVPETAQGDEDDGDGGSLFGDDDEDMQDGGFLRETQAAEDQMGGGFLPEDSYNEGGGGFLVEDAEEPSGPAVGVSANDAGVQDAEMVTPEALLTTTDKEQPIESASHAGDPPKRESATDNNTLAPNLTAAAADRTIESRSGGIDTIGTRESAAASTVPVTATNPTAAPDQHAAATSNENQEWTAINVDDDNNDSDHGSLLSHDPEDDDAEPDWLESD